MKLKILTKKIVQSNRLINIALLKLKHRRISLGFDVKMVTTGNFKYGDSCSIDERSYVNVSNCSKVVLGNRVCLGKEVEIGSDYCDIVIGDDVSVQDRTIVRGSVKIGSFSLIGPDCHISTVSHNFITSPNELIRDQDLDTNADDKLPKAIAIEEDCWLGANVNVLPGVRIMKGSIIAANSLVIRDIKPFSVVGGIPAKKITNRISFIPPTTIRYNNLDQLPYFYSGFEISRERRALQNEHNGVLAKKNFSIKMNISNKNYLIMIAKSLGNYSIIKSNKIDVLINNKFNKYRFDLKKLNINKYNEIIFEQNGVGFFLKEAYLE
jgi:acetyltransferase-like isoleucine patch superfamily enzyme